MKTRRMRLGVQIIFFALILGISLYHNILDEGVSLHGICPFGGVVTFYNYITAGSFIKKVHYSSILIMYLVLFMAIIAGPVFCGWVCPLGSIQEWIGKIGRKVFKDRHNAFVPKKIDKILRYFRIIVLIWVVYITIQSAQLMFQNIDPYFALFNFWTGEVAISAILMLMAVLVGALFIERPWCKYLCPYGAFLGFFNKIRIFKIRRNDGTCIHCHKCNKSCPMNLEIEGNKAVNDFQCISCLECTSESACPVENTVELKVRGYQNETKS
jgi:polyferredoxin